MNVIAKFRQLLKEAVLSHVSHVNVVTIIVLTWRVRAAAVLFDCDISQTGWQLQGTCLVIALQAWRDESFNEL